MSFLKIQCSRCGGRLRRGDSVIKAGKFFAYHPECYRKNREEAFEGIKTQNQRSLEEARTNLDAFRNLVDSKMISETESFHQTWGKQLMNITRFSMIIANAEMFGSLGFVKKIRLKRRLNQYRNSLFAIADSYREVYGALKIERCMRELYPSTAEPTIEQLRDEERKALETIKEQIIEQYDDLETLYSDVKKISRKTALRMSKELRRQIQEIPRQIETL